MANLIDEKGNGLPARSCATCRFMESAPLDPKTLQRAMVCKWGPPQLTLVPTPQGMAIAAMPVQVNAQTWCHRHELTEPAN